MLTLLPVSRKQYWKNGGLKVGVFLLSETGSRCWDEWFTKSAVSAGSAQTKLRLYPGITLCPTACRRCSATRQKEFEGSITKSVRDKLSCLDSKYCLNKDRLFLFVCYLSRRPQFKNKNMITSHFISASYFFAILCFVLYTNFCLYYYNIALGINKKKVGAPIII